MEIQYFDNWDYQKALDWMQDAQQKALFEDVYSIGYGQHSKNIITLGRHADDADVHASSKDNIEIHRINRGGKATVHGPGQLVLYPVVNLEKIKLGVREFSCLLEEFILNLLRDYGLVGHRSHCGAGIFVDGEKISSIGFHVHKGVVTHGLSLNVSNDLRIFDLIVPCGMVDGRITSLHELGIYEARVENLGGYLSDRMIHKLYT